MTVLRQEINSALTTNFLEFSLGIVYTTRHGTAILPDAKWKSLIAMTTFTWHSNGAIDGTQGRPTAPLAIGFSTHCPTAPLLCRVNEPFPSVASDSAPVRGKIGYAEEVHVVSLHSIHV